MFLQIELQVVVSTVLGMQIQMKDGKIAISHEVIFLSYLKNGI